MGAEETSYCPICENMLTRYVIRVKVGSIAVQARGFGSEATEYEAQLGNT
jgi:hypothetical protein